MSPGYRLSLNAVEGAPSSGRILLHRVDGKPLVVELEQLGVPESVDVRIEAVTASGESEGRVEAKPGDVWIIASVDGTTGAVNHNGAVSFTTNHPEVPRIEVPIYIRVRPMIDIRPQRVTLWPADGGPHGTTTLVRLTHSERREFEVTAVEVSDPKLVTAELQSQGAQRMHSVRITLVDGLSLSESSAAATVRLATSDEAKPTIEIPVVITRESQAARRSISPKSPPSTGSTADTVLKEKN